ncbi:MAG: rhamnogalacturonan lyase, partial [Clostridium sp.]
MKKHFKKIAAAIAIGTLLSPLSNTPIVSQAATARQVEALNRGLVGVKTNQGVFLSWRLLGTDSYDTSFNIYRNGTKIAGPITDSTNYLDKNGSQKDKYFVRTVVNGVEKTESDPVNVWNNNYLDVPINKPGNNYSANDASVADVDGDGEYEIILKWDPSDSKDNSQSGYTSNVYIDCYEMDGTQKWRIDLGKNIRAGAHYTQFIVYDLNGDGKAEIAMKTADGTVAGDGTVIGDKNKDYRNSSGYVLDGPEYLTLFEGATGKILNTVDFTPQRGTVSSWGDKYGNRVDRFLAGVAYLDGKTPSLIMCRGYYTRSVISAYKYKNGQLSKQWTFDTNDSGNSAYAGQGSHSLSVADVDNDGYDEIVYGSAVIDHNGKGLYSTKMGHGDALHVGDFDPNHSGLEIYQVHEDKSSNIESVQMRDAKTGKTLWSKKTGTDVGRGVIANIGPDFYPYVAMSSAGNFDKNGNQVNINLGKFGLNFVTWWDGDLYREGLDKTYINKWNSNTKSADRLLTGSNVHSNNGTKATPSLSGDILGDWREEVIWPTSDDTALRIYTTTDITKNKLYTFMHDTQYREAIAWQNVGYNQPPHPSFYVGPDMKTPSQPNVYTVGKYKEKEVNGSQSSGSQGGSQDTVKQGENIQEGKYR